MTRTYGIDTEEEDNESYETGKKIIRQQAAEDWSYSKLLEKYEHLRSVTLKNIPNLWLGLEFALSIKSILNIKGCSLPFAGILLGPASSLKTVIIECFKGYHNVFYTDNFSPKSLVSHISGKTEEQLRKDDLLPKLKNSYFLTPELAPIFSSRDDDLLQLLGILTRILDGQGYESDTGACGHRGYDEDIMFTWLGASVDIPYKVHKLLGTLGPKLYFFRLPRVESSEDDYFNSRNDDFSTKTENIRVALIEYLTYSDMNPEAEIVGNLEDSESEGGLRKIALDPDKDEELAHRVIIRIAKLLARLRAIVPTWETKDTQGSEYAYGLAKIEDPSRAITQLRNLARGHALSRGRNYITLDDVPIIIHTALSTATAERVSMFDLLIANSGILSSAQICEFLNTTKPTALRTMSELKATGLVYLDLGDSRTPSKIKLKPEFDWLLSYQFQELKQRKEKCPPQRGVIQTLLYDSIINKKILSSLHHTDPFSGGKISLRKLEDNEKNCIVEKPRAQAPEIMSRQQKTPVSLSSKVDQYFIESGLYPKTTIRDSYVRVGNQALLLREPCDILLSKIHPGILDNSIKVEFVTSKTTTSAMVRFLKGQHYRSYYYSCYHCYDVSKATFSSIDEYERHIVTRHKPGTVGYPGGPDIEKRELERVRMMQSR